MRISVLADLISKEIPCAVSGLNEDFEIRRFLFLSGTINGFDDSCLYIGKSEYLAKAAGRVTLLTTEDEIPEQILLAHTVLRIAPEDYAAGLNLVTKTFFAEQEREETFNRLLSRPVDQTPFHEIINNAAVFMDRSLVLTDLSFRVVDYSTSRAITDPIWKANVKRGFSSYEFIEAMNVLIPDHSIPDTSEPFFVNCDVSRENKLCSMLFYNQRPIGYLVLLDNEKGILPYHIQYLSRVSQILVLSMKHAPNFRNLFINASENIFLNMLEGRDTDPEQMKLLRESMKIPKAMRCMVFVPKNHSRHDLFYLQRNLYSLFSRGSVFLYQDYVIAVVSDENSKLILSPTFWEKEAGSKSPAEEKHIKNVKEVGVSSVFRSLTDFPDYLQYAWKACEIANKLGHDEIVHLYDRYQFLHMLSTCQEQKLLQAYVHPAFDILREYDLANDSALLMTLQTYIEKGLNAKETAMELYLHRNTLNYRLNKIKELTDMDFEDLETVFRLSCSFRINQLLQIY